MLTVYDPQLSKFQVLPLTCTNNYSGTDTVVYGRQRPWLYVLPVPGATARPRALAVLRDSFTAVYSHGLGMRPTPLQPHRSRSQVHHERFCLRTMRRPRACAPHAAAGQLLRVWPRATALAHSCCARQTAPGLPSAHTACVVHRAGREGPARTPNKRSATHTIPSVAPCAREGGTSRIPVRD